MPLLIGCSARGQGAPGRPAPTPAFAEIEKIDVHSHVFDDIPYLVEMLRRDNFRVVNIANRGTDGNLDIMHRILPAEVLRKFYADNALRLIPGLSETPHGWRPASAGAARPAGMGGRDG